MKHVYFAGPVSIDPETATREKKRFLVENWDVFRDADVNVYSPHMMYKWLTDTPENTGKGSPPEEYALNSCLNLIDAVDFDAIIMLTEEGQESSGMRKEKDLAREKGIPVHNYPYFSTADGELTINGADREGLKSLLKEL
ncbi:MAG: DUF4406 domain-containing protein [Candidatus Nanohaloarchaeota archaeon QJJ-5]|nr:DUF4406 domain-containing protein [Candidatus Nanohaloarchaeota archaeon QJJ-5]